METIEAVIFDWGGVLIEDPAAALYSYCAEALGAGLQEFINIYQKFESDFITGNVTEEQFWSAVCGDLKKQKPAVKSLWYAAFEAAYRPRNEMFVLADELDENGYRTAVLSNTEPPAVKFFYNKGLDKLFETAIFSCVEHTRKPERKIYDLAAGRLGLKAFQCVFIDDKIEYVKAAEAAGMSGIWYRSFPQVESELKTLGVDTD